MGVLLGFPLETSSDVAVCGQLTRDVAREAGLASLEQSKLATVVAGLARRCLSSAAAGEVTFSIEGAPGDLRLVVAVFNVSTADEGAGLVAAMASSGRAALGLDFHNLRRLVDDFEQTAQPDGSARVVAAVRLNKQLADDSGLIARVKALHPGPKPATKSLRKATPFNEAALLDNQSKQLEQAMAELARVNQERVAGHAELERVNQERNAVNAELALTNRGVLDLVAELSTANESLTLTGARYRQLADQQSALADLGHRAVASHDITALAMGLVGILRRVLGAQLVGVLKFETSTPTLEVVANEGSNPDLPATISVNRRQAHKLAQEGTLLVDLTVRPGDFPVPTPPGSRSGAVVAVHTPAGPWGVLVTCDKTPDHYTPTTTAFLEAAASLLAFSIARMASEEATQHAAHHDGLTGLPNRAQLLEHMDRTLDDAPERAGIHVSEPSKVVIFLDIDGFKQVNDTAGHAAGDQILKVAAARLRAVMRPADVLARLGGDEFVALCEGGFEAAEAISRRLLSAFDEPFVIKGREVFLSASAGLALVGAGVTADQVLADADIAMYQAKLTPGSATAVFNPQMRSIADSESLLHSELRRALGRGQLRAVYQPVVDLSTGSVHGVETLLRWRHPDLGDVPAQQTVAAAERIGLAWELTCWITAEAARTISAWNGANPAHPPLRLAVNFTPLLLSDPGRVGELEALVTAAGLPFSLLDIELTETAFVDPTPSALALLADLRHRGARLSMDDFGTGYSSLMTVANLPLDVLKIDRSFVTPLQIGGDTLLVAAMTGIARGRRLETIGEGIETNTQLAALIAAECDLGQGYLFAKPLEKDQLEALATLESGFADTIRAARPTLVGDSLIHSSRSDGTAQTAQILVLEQNPDDLELLQSILKGSGYQITGLSDPAAFDAAVRDTQPDLILMGLRFRGTSGFDLMEHAKAPLTMPIVAVTGLPDWALRNEPRSSHFAAIIRKPVHPSELLTQIRELLANHPHPTKATAVEHAHDPSSQPVVGFVVPRVVLEATRALVRVERPVDAVRIVTALVLGLGGAVVSADATDASAIPADLSFGEGVPMLASARPGSKARLLLDQYLPAFLLDVRQALEMSERVERLAQSSSTDVLTGLPNRRVLERSLGRLSTSEAVIMLDLDHFKAVNDELGHAVGDDVLRAFGGALLAAVRGRDTLGRYGGEEFVVILPAFSDPDSFLARLRDHWRVVRPHPVTFSAGIALSAGDRAEVMTRADKALYQAKESGRDRWIWAQAGVPATPRLPSDYVKPYLDDALTGDRTGGVRRTLDLLDHHVPHEQIVVDLLAAAQRAVGERWQRNELTPAHEHLASGVAAAALDALAGETSRVNVSGLTVVSCAEGDWHSLAAQMFGESLRTHGFGVRVLGASTPVEAVADFLERSSCDAFAVSCSLPTYFPGVLRLIDVAHTLGIPTIVGGRAFGLDSRRAHHLGADAWAASASDAAPIIAGWRSSRPIVNPDPVPLDAVAARLFAAADQLGGNAMQALTRSFPAMAAYDAVRITRTREDLVYIVQFLAASLASGDDTVFFEFLTWLQHLLACRGVPAQALVAGLQALRPGVGQADDGAGRLLDAGREVLVPRSAARAVPL